MSPRPATVLALSKTLVIQLGAILMLAILLGAAPMAAQAQAANPPQILTLDQDRFYAGSLYGKALEAKSLAATQDLAQENRKIEADLAAEEAALTVQRPKVTPAEFGKLASDFDAKVERIRAEQDAKANRLAEARDDGRKLFFNAAVPVLAELMRKLGAYAILNHDAVVLSFDSIDVTARAITAIDAKLGDGSPTPAPITPSPVTPTPVPPSPVPPSPVPPTSQQNLPVSP